ncbi:MAG: 23S rRNA (uracil(1939)-C(5))-methyltransferase RlmD [Eggerthellaceae bacterium]|nr:23S rRNA (uracil(1939)-C(5))-methyltransferase RlmD [Eggerthellaceae bacterium]
MQESPTNTQTVRIERMAYSPSAVAKAQDGKTLFIDGGAPGDVAKVSIIEQKPSYAIARIEEIVEPSAKRAQNSPVCAASCGGCPWAHLSYEAQCASKRDNVVDALVRIGKMDTAHVNEIVDECVPSKKQWGYRNKLELGVSTDKQGKLTLGMFVEGSHDLTPIASCPLANKYIEKTPKALQGALRFASGADSLGIFRIGIRASVRTKSTEVALWTPPSAFPRAHVANTLMKSGKYTSIVRVLADPGKARKVKKVERLSGQGCWEEELHDARFLTSAPSFFQVNTAQAEVLITRVLDSLSDVEGAYIADLYAGGGTFTIPLAQAGADVVAVEAASSSVSDLRRNAEINGVFVDAVCGDAAKELSSLGTLDALVVDPPRSGLAQSMIKTIAKAKPRTIVYVSCNPATLARDIERFGKTGYQPKRVTPVDMFPQTYHVETVVSLVRASK